MREGGDGVEETRRCEAFTGFFVLCALDGDDRRANAIARGALRDVLSADIELIRGRT